MNSFSDKLKGKVEQGVGDLTDNEKTQSEGKLDEVTGRIKEHTEDMKHDASVTLNRTHDDANDKAVKDSK